MAVKMIPSMLMYKTIVMMHNEGDRNRVEHVKDVEAEQRESKEDRRNRRGGQRRNKRNNRRGGRRNKWGGNSNRGSTPDKEEAEGMEPQTSTLLLTTLKPSDQ